MAPDIGSIPEPPTARVGQDRRDPYGWITEPTAELIGLLDAERGYYEARTAPLAEMRAVLAAEMTARVPDRSESAPWLAGAFTYRNVYGVDSEFPALVRCVGAGPDETVLDLQAIAAAHPGAEFHPGELQVSPDGSTLTWSCDVVGDERYRLRFRDLRTGTDLPGVIRCPHRRHPLGGMVRDHRVVADHL